MSGCDHWRYVLDYHVCEDEDLGCIAWCTCRNCGEVVRTYTPGTAA